MAVLFGLTTAVNAQTFVGTFSGGLPAFGIPGQFTNDGHSYFCAQNEDGSFTVYDNDFTTCIATIEGLDLDIDGIILSYANFSEAAVYENTWPGLILTQNLFNSDSDFEYIEKFETGWHIKSTNGSIVQTINTDNGYIASGDVMIIKLDGFYYLALGEWYQQENTVLVYRIDQTQGLTKVDVELPVSVFPSIANRSQQITVELGEGNNATEITVVNGLGQVIKRVPVEEGQRSITIPASGLGSGLNVINTRTQQGQGSCKIIVR